jgi:histidyl-tRNA synthetase
LPISFFLRDNSTLIMPVILSVRGMRDLLPEDTAHWQAVETTAAACFARYGYAEIRTPMVERTALFCRQLGEHTDVVQKEMYSFIDAGGEELSLRPEATVPTVRALVENGLRRGGLERVWYGGPMFRRERPQKGRYRQFWQLGAEAVGVADPVIDAEQIIMLAQLWNDMGVQDKLCLVVNNLGTADERAHHREKLRTHFRHHESQLDDAARARIDGNPLRILDSKNKSVQEVVNTAPLLANELGTASQQHVASVKNMITGAGIDFVEDTTLVRGLDYYNLTVFEWVLKDDSRRQSTLCGGGRYDGLSEQIGGPALPGCGFALGLDRLAALVDKASHPAPTCYLVTTGGSDSYCTTVAEQLRKNVLSVWRHVGGGNLARQLKKADAMNTALAVIVGTDEESAGEVTLKRLCDGEQQQVLTSRVAETAAMMMIQTG